MVRRQHRSESWSLLLLLLVGCATGPGPWREDGSLPVPGSGETAQVERPAPRTLHLMSPVESAELLPATAVRGPDYPRLSSPLSFEWTPLPEGVVYHLTIREIRDPSRPREAATTVTLVDKRLATPWFHTPLPRSRGRSVYELTLTAHDLSGETVGEYRTRYPTGSVAYLRFRVP